MKSPKRFRRVAATATALLTVVLAGCSGNAGSSGGANGAPAGPPRSGGSYTHILFSDSRSLDAAVMIPSATTAGGPVGAALYDGLIWTDPTSTAWKPGLATAFDTTDGVTWTMKLRSGVKFSDGTDFNADAVKFTWDRLADPKLGSPSGSVVRNFQSVTVTDPQTVVVKLKSPNYLLPQQFGYYPINYVVSPTAVQKEGADFGTKPVGAGPFVVQSWTPNQEVVLTKNPTYWDKDRPYLDRLTIRFSADPVQSMNSIQAGEAQSVGFSDLYNPSVGEDMGLNAQSFALDGGTALVMNWAKAPFNNPTARKAVSLAINLDSLNQTVLRGKGKMVTTIFREDSPYYDRAYTLPTNPSATPNPVAQKMFDELAAETGGPLTFSIASSQNANAAALSQAVLTQLAAYKNVNVTFNQLDGPGYARAFSTGDFTAILGGGGGTPEPGLFELLHTGGTTNWGKVSVPGIDAALDAARAAPDEAGRKQAYADLQKAYIDSVPMVLLAHLSWATVYSKDVTGVEMAGQGVPIMSAIGFAAQ